MIIKKSKEHICSVFDTFDETGINWKVDIWKSPGIRHRKTETQKVLMKRTQIILMGEEGLIHC